MRGPWREERSRRGSESCFTPTLEWLTLIQVCPDPNARGDSAFWDNLMILKATQMVVAREASHRPAE